MGFNIFNCFNLPATFNGPKPMTVFSKLCLGGEYSVNIDSYATVYQ